MSEFSKGDKKAVDRIIDNFNHESKQANLNVGKGTKIWHYTNIHPTAVIGKNCVIGSYVEVGANARIGNNCKVQAFAFIAAGTIIEDNVFIGPHVAIANDKYPAAVTQDGKLKELKDWKLQPTRICKGAVIGINATIGAGITVGQGSMVGAAANVTKDVPAGVVICGNPAKIHNKNGKT